MKKDDKTAKSALSARVNKSKPIRALPEASSYQVTDEIGFRRAVMACVEKEGKSN